MNSFVSDAINFVCLRGREASINWSVMDEYLIFNEYKMCLLNICRTHISANIGLENFNMMFSVSMRALTATGTQGATSLTFSYLFRANRTKR